MSLDNGLDTRKNFIVDNDLITPVILGCDFLKYDVLLDYGKSTFYCKNSCVQSERLNIQTNMLVS